MLHLLLDSALHTPTLFSTLNTTFQQQIIFYFFFFPIFAHRNQLIEMEHGVSKSNKE